MRLCAVVAIALAACTVSNPPPGPFGPQQPPPSGPPPTGTPEHAPANGPPASLDDGPAPGTFGVAPGGTVSNAQTSAVVLACEQRANAVPGNTGTSWYMQCPRCETASARVWGSDIYTDDSSVCAAALHAGMLPPLGGVVLVTWIPGQLAYIGSERVGIKSLDYGKWGRSFFVQSIGVRGQPTAQPPARLPPNTVRLSCTMPGNTVPPNEAFHVICPPGCSTGRLWGTDVYTGDSSACLAAVHSGLATIEKGGTITVTVGGAMPGFEGSARHGVTSQKYGSYGSSFRVGP